MNMLMVYPYFQSKKYDLKLKTDVLEVSCRLVKHEHKVVVSRLERTALPVMRLSKALKFIESQPLLYRVREHS